jgi:hypothetical protein
LAPGRHYRRERLGTDSKGRETMQRVLHGCSGQRLQKARCLAPAFESNAGRIVATRARRREQADSITEQLDCYSPNTLHPRQRVFFFFSSFLSPHSLALPRAPHLYDRCTRARIPTNVHVHCRDRRAGLPTPTCDVSFAPILFLLPCITRLPLSTLLLQLY